MSTGYTVSLLDNLPRSSLAEGPFWDDQLGRLLWVDIEGRAIHCYDPETGRGTTHSVSDAVGFVVLADHGRIVAGISDGIYDLALGSAVETPLVRPQMHSENRFNDAKCDPRGRLWAGTMHRSATRDREPTGALYSWHRGGLVLVEPHIAIANGLGWSPTGDTMYFADTHRGTIWAYDYDLASGEVTNRRAFAEVPIDVGVPDGLTVDREGRVIVAIWRGARLNIYGPSGDLKSTISMPVRNPTSCCFGGADLKTLFVTTASGLNEDDPRSGCLFAVGMNAPGQLSARMGCSL